MLADAMLVGCWNDRADQSANGKFVDGDANTACGASKASDSGSIAGAVKFNPLMQEIAASKFTQWYWQSTAAVTRDKFADGTSHANDVSITAAMQLKRAKAQAALWFMDFRKLAMENALLLVGDATKKAAEEAVNVDTWKTRDLGKAELAQASKVKQLAAATANHAAALRWEAAATQEEADAETDIAAARTLLADLTKDIAPLARAEFTYRADVATAKADVLARAAASEALGTAFVAATTNPVAAAKPATGARAVLAAAKLTKDSVEAQQKFHDARAKWALDNFTPMNTQLLDEEAEKAALDKKILEGQERLDRARENCKRAAFEKAQAAREAAIAAAKARTDKAAAVKTKYSELSKFQTDGSVNTLCNFPKVGAADPPKPRKECLEGEPGKPLCCGAAQRFLKDGTKLSIETCQLATATTYTYYPALPADAVVAPTVETWRFQCISAAQKLAAAATAALAAGYMMA